MYKALTLLCMEAGRDLDGFAREMRRIEGVTNAYLVYGTHDDVLVEVEADTPEKLESIVKEKVRRHEYVRSTITLIAVEQV